MKENSVEEDIINAQHFINSIKTDKDYKDENGWHGYYNREIVELVRILDHILSDYKRVLKENEELKSKNKTLEELLQGNLYELYKYYKELAGTYQENCILVQEVTDKIEKEIKYHEKNILDIENTTMLKGKTTKEEAEIEFNKYAIVVLKKMLQELLEGRK